MMSALIGRESSRRRTPVARNAAPTATIAVKVRIVVARAVVVIGSGYSSASGNSKICSSARRSATSRLMPSSWIELPPMVENAIAVSKSGSG